MAKIDNLAKSDLKDIWKAIRDLRHATPLNKAAIGRGGLRVHSGGVITIENGGLRVTGTATIIGKLIASGTIEFNGPVKITGPLDISGLTQIMGSLILKAGGKFTAGSIELNPDGSAKFGTMTIDPTGKITSGSAIINPDGSATFGLFEIAENGDLESKGALSIEGPTSLKNDLTVDQGFKITLGGLILENQGLGSAQVQMPGGGLSSSNTLGMLLNHDTIMIAAQILLTLAAPKTMVTGQLDVASLLHARANFYSYGTAIFSGPILHSAITSHTEPPNLYVDANGRHWRSSSASRFKIDQQLMDLPESLLDPVMKDWIDAGSQARFDQLHDEPRPFREEDQMEYDSINLRRVPGMVAEDVAASGGEAFATYDSAGQIQGFSYDRFALARTQVLAKQLEAEQVRTDKLEQRLQKLEALIAG